MNAVDETRHGRHKLAGNEPEHPVGFFRPDDPVAGDVPVIAADMGDPLDGLQQGVGCQQRLLGRFAGSNALLDRNCPLDRGRQAQQVAFEHIILGASVQQLDGGFVAQHAGDHDDRDLGMDLPGMCQRLGAAELGQPAVGQHDIGREGIERLEKTGPVVDPPGDEFQPCLAQFALDQLGVDGLVVEDEDLQSDRARGSRRWCDGLDRARWRRVLHQCFIDTAQAEIVRSGASTQQDRRIGTLIRHQLFFWFGNAK